MDSLTDVILRTYKELKTIKRVQFQLGISYYKITKTLHANNINPSKKGKRLSIRFYNCLVKWIYEHPGVILPRSPAKIAEMTKCTQDSIRTFLYRQRKVMRKYLKTHNPLAETRIFTDSKGIKLNYSMVATYSRIKTDYLNSIVVYKLRLRAVKNKRYYVKLNIKEYLK